MFPCAPRDLGYCRSRAEPAGLHERLAGLALRSTNGHCLFSFRWVSREQTCADLVAFLSNEPPRRSRRRFDLWTAAQLLRTLAVPEVAPVLRQISLDASQDHWIRWCAIVSLARSGATFSAKEVENGLTLDPCRAPDHLGERLVTLVRNAAALAAAREQVALTSPEKRAEILEHGGLYENLEPTRYFETLRDEVYAGWLERDRHVLAPDRVLRVAARTLSRAESWRILEYSLQTAGSEERGYVLDRLAERDRLALVRNDPVLLREAVDRLAVPATDLVEHLGEEALVDGLERRIHELSAVLSTPRHGHEPEGEAHVCLNVLTEWARSAGPRAGKRLEALLEADLDPLFWPKLERAFVACDRARAACWLERRIDETRSGATILGRIVDGPRIEDRSLLERALAAGPAFRYLAIDGLEKLGAAEPALLERVARDDSDEVVRLRARGALALRGDAQSERILAGRATRVRGVEARAEAVRWLAELDPPRHFDALENALLEGLDYVEDYYQPVAEAAAFGVARLGGVEALSTLLHAAFRVGNSVSGIVEGYMSDILERRPIRRETRWRRTLDPERPRC